MSDRLPQPDIVSADDDAGQCLSLYADMVYQIVSMRTHSPHDADDAFQDVFLSYIKSGKQFESEEHRKAWLIRVAINASNKLYASSWFRKTVPLEGETIAVPPPDDEGLHDALRRLPEQYRTVLYLYYYQGMSTREIGDALHLREKAVHMRLSRARRMLKDHLESEV